MVVKKPWGCEYLCYSNQYVAIWLLNIDANKQTSMHCHTKKNTSLVVLNGEVELSFLDEKRVLSQLGLAYIQERRFHSTRCVSEKCASLLEVEYPVNKHDLVRLFDAGGRTNSLYESSEFHFPKLGSELLISKPSFSSRAEIFSGRGFRHIKISSLESSLSISIGGIVIVTDGGLVTEQGDFVFQVGDVCSSNEFIKLQKSFRYHPETTLIIVD